MSFLQAQAALDEGNHALAAELFEALVAREPSVQASAGLGIALSNLGRLDQAAPHLSRAAQQGSDNPGVFVGLGDYYFALGRMDLAGSAFERASVLLPDSGRAKVKFANTLIRLGRVEEAERELQRAIELEPDLAAAYDMTAFLLPQLGRFQEAREFARKAIELDPQHPFYAVRYIYGERITEADRSVVERLTSIAASDALDVQNRIRVEFGLGKAFEDLERFDEAARHYVKANGLADAERARRGGGFDREEHRREVDHIIETTPKVAGACPPGSDSDTPIFVVGMMRSGSTLAEQILSSHPEIGGAGEVPFWIENAPRLHHAVTVRRAYSEVRATAEAYLRVLEGLTPGKKRICDKLLQNYMSLGILHAALPNARIVHCRRDPRDTCLSLFTTPFTYPPPFAYRSDDIGFAYGQYLRLMAHWRAVLPADRFLEVDYEDLVNDQEATSRRMIEFAGVGWDEACLRPDRNPRRVGNPSQWQVRQPVYGSSIGRWRRFEPWLKDQLRQWDLS